MSEQAPNQSNQRPEVSPNNQDGGELRRTPSQEEEWNSSPQEIVAFLERGNLLNGDKSLLQKGLYVVFYGALYNARNEGKIPAGIEDNRDGLVSFLDKVPAENRLKISNLLQDHLYATDPVKKTDIEWEIRPLLDLP